MSNNLYKCPICGGPTNYSSINYQPQPCLHCSATLKPADQQHGNDQYARLERELNKAQAALRFIAEWGGRTLESEYGDIEFNGKWCAEQAKEALK